MLQTIGLRKRHGRTEVLRGLDLTVAEGEVYGFLGRNGAGKSTTLGAVMGMHAVDAGQIVLFGEAVRRPGVREKRLIGYVGQEQHFYPWMDARQLGRFVRGLYPTWDDALFESLLARFDVPPKRKAHALSGGTRVKLALCLALAHRPRLLVLDEPTSGLDPAARREFLDLVSEQARDDGRTTIFSTHIVEEVERIADTVGILDGGALRVEAPLATLAEEVREARLGGRPVPLGVEVVGTRRERDGDVIVARAPVERWAADDVAGWSRPRLEDAFLAYTVHHVPSSP